MDYHKEEHTQNMTWNIPAQKVHLHDYSVHIIYSTYDG